MGEVIASPFGDRARPGSGGPSLERLASFATNDLGNAYRLILMAGGAVEDDDSGPVVDSTNSRLLFVLGLGWFGFNGRFWDRDCGEDLARKLAHRVALLIPSLYPIFKEKGTPDKDFWKFANETGSAGKTSAMLIQAKSYLGASLSDFDQDLYAINCLNGTLKMRYCDGKFRKSLAPHNPADRITRCTATNYNPDAKAPEFLGVLEKALAKKDERAAFHRMCGYASTGNTQDQAFFFVQGPGQDSKSTLLDACREALGTYGVASKPDTFLESNNPVNRGPEPDIIALAGDSRFVILSEPPRGAKLAEGKLKGWTGGEPLAARDLHSQQINFRPVPKLIFECNSFPVIKGDDDGIYRRIHVVLFRRKVPDSEVDRTLPCRLRENELSGILNWLVDGVGDWMAQGLNWPDSLKIVVRDWRQQASPFGDWLSEYCLIREEARNARELSSVLYKSFKAWCEDQGNDRIMSQKAFGDALRDRQIMLAGKNSAGQKFRGPIRLRTEDELRAYRLADEAQKSNPRPPAETASISAGGVSESAQGFEPGADLDVEWPE